MRGSDKEYGEYKNEKLFLMRRNGKKMRKYKNENWVKMVKSG